MRRVYENLCLATISVSIMAANMWKNSLKNVESDNNKTLYETLLDFVLQRNGTYFLNKPRISICVTFVSSDLKGSYRYHFCKLQLQSVNSVHKQECLQLTVIKDSNLTYPVVH